MSSRRRGGGRCDKSGKAGSRGEKKGGGGGRGKSAGVYWYNDIYKLPRKYRRGRSGEGSRDAPTSKQDGAKSNRGKGHRYRGEGKTSRVPAGHDGDNDEDDDNRVGDDNLDAEGEHAERSHRQHLEMGGDDEVEITAEDEASGVGTNSPRSPRGGDRGRSPRSGTSAGGAASADMTIVGKLSHPKKNRRGTHFMARKPWVTTAKKSIPTKTGETIEDLSGASLDSCLHLEHVHGFRGDDLRNNLYYAKDGTIVYVAAALGICVDPNTQRQRYMGAHTDDIISIALLDSTKKKWSFVATGEIGRKPKIIIWKSSTMKVVRVIKGAHSRGVVRLAFSDDNKTLASVGRDNENSLALHNWRTGDQLASMRTGGDKVYGLVFSSKKGAGYLVTCGHRHMTFWEKEKGAGRGGGSRAQMRLNDKNARFGRELSGKLTIIDCCFDGAGRTIAATSGGHLAVFGKGGSRSVSMLPFGKGSVEGAHKGSVYCVETVPGGEHFVSGGEDGIVNLWECPSDLDMPVSNLRKFRFPAQIPAVQSLSVAGWTLNDPSARVLIGTRGGDVLEINLQDGTRLNDRSIVTGHNFGELWGLAAHPSDPLIFATSGDDKTVRVWDVGLRQCIAITPRGALPDMARALAYSPDGLALAVGLGGRIGGRKVGEFGKHAGCVVMMDANKLKVLGMFKVAKEQISDLVFSPDGGTLCAASNDNLIYVLQVRGKKVGLRARLFGHSSFVTDISISQDSKWLMSNDGAAELLFFNLETGKREPKASTIAKSKARWAPNTCPCSWETLGIWPGDGDLTDINAAHSPNGLDLCVAADDFGKVRLFNSPVMSWNAPSMVHRGHSAHVTNVCFNADNTLVFSVGGGDRCAMIWRLHNID